MVFGFGGSPYKSDPAAYASQAPKGAQANADVSPNSIDKTYDYVIIGCGTAGSVLASRLSQDAHVSVCVIEAGGDPSGVLETKIPAAFGKLYHSVHDWDYTTVPQKGVDNREMFLPRGKMIGGSSSMNAMMHQTVPPSDCDEWSEKLGCKGWAYKDLLPYMRRTEKFTMHAQRPAIDLSHRGDSGEWQTGYSYLTEVGEKGFIEACQENGIPYVPDINTPTGPLGVSRFQTFIDQKGQRSSARTAFLGADVLARKNLTIGIHAHVTRILTDASSAEPVAFGVEFQTKQQGPYWRVRASKEVILCGGAYNTPQTLMLSGIGPADELKKHGIKVVRESKDVGKNLFDHLCPSGLYAKAKSPAHTLDYMASDIKSLPAIARWLITGGGPATSNVGETAAFIRTVEHASNVKDYGSLNKGPDIEYICTPLAFRDHGATCSPAGSGTVSLAVVGLRPQSVGSVTLKDADPWSKAVIDHAYLTDAEGNDRKVLIAGIRLGFKILRSEAFKPYLSEDRDDNPDSFWWPASATNHDDITDEQLTAWMGKNAFTLYHPIGSARMGADEDSVVDLQLRVRGVKGLRVVDASVFPTQIAGHPTSCVIAFGEKASDLIRGRVADNEDATHTSPVASQAAIPSANL